MSSEVHIWSQVKHTDAKTQTRFMLKQEILAPDCVAEFVTFKPGLGKVSYGQTLNLSHWKDMDTVRCADKTESVDCRVPKQSRISKTLF